MSFKTLIQWCHHTTNFWIGCAKLIGGMVEGSLVREDPACFNCYAAELDRTRFSKTLDGASKEHPKTHWGKGAPRHLTQTWGEPLKWNRDIERQIAERCQDGEAAIDDSPIERPRVFCGSLCDWADCEVSDEVRSRAFDVIDQCPNLDWMLLSKREQKAVEFLMKRYGRTLPDYIWLGFSAGNQEAYDIRSEAMDELVARVKFFSFEPLFQEIYFGDTRRFDLGIFGGESGPRARPQNVGFIRSGIEQCRKLGISPFVKQLGEHAFEEAFPENVTEREDLNFKAFGWCRMSGFPKHPNYYKKTYSFKDKKGGEMSEWPREFRVREMPGTPLFAK
jgi:protein gp37